MADSNDGKAVLTTTVSQTVGPFFHIGLGWLFSDGAVDPGSTERTITVQGQVIDGAGAPVPDALLETWHADGSGHYGAPEDDPERRLARFGGFARCPTNSDGHFRLRTSAPGPVPASGGGLQAPHIVVALFMRGLLRHAVTRIYFADDATNDADWVLARVPQHRRHTLLAQRRSPDSEVYEWNIVLQGPDETVFFDV